jgi:hypothetical protein
MKINYCLEQVIRPVAPKIVGPAKKAHRYHTGNLMLFSSLGGGCGTFYKVIKIGNLVLQDSPRTKTTPL